MVGKGGQLPGGGGGRVARPGDVAGERGYLAWLRGGQVQRDPLAEIVERRQQLERGVTAAQRGEVLPHVGAQLSWRVRQDEYLAQLGLLPHLVEELKGGPHAEVHHHAPERLGGEHGGALIGAGGHGDPRGRVKLREGGDRAGGGQRQQAAARGLEQ